MDETRMRQAYMEAMKLKNSGFDQEVIYARLEKKGFPEDIAREVAKNVMLEQKKEVKKQQESNYQFALIKIGVGVIAAIISVLVLPGVTVVPIG